MKSGNGKNPTNINILFLNILSMEKLFFISIPIPPIHREDINALYVHEDEEIKSFLEDGYYVKKLHNLETSEKVLVSRIAVVLERM